MVHHVDASEDEGDMRGYITIMVEVNCDDEEDLWRQGESITNHLDKVYPPETDYAGSWVSETEIYHDDT